jgi:hypothetical protein
MVLGQALPPYQHNYYTTNANPAPAFDPVGAASGATNGAMTWSTNVASYNATNGLNVAAFTGAASSVPWSGVSGAPAFDPAGAASGVTAAVSNAFILSLNGVGTNETLYGDKYRTNVMVVIPSGEIFSNGLGMVLRASGNSYATNYGVAAAGPTNFINEVAGAITTSAGLTVGGVIAGNGSAITNTPWWSVANAPSGGVSINSGYYINAEGAISASSTPTGVINSFVLGGSHGVWVSNMWVYLPRMSGAGYWGAGTNVTLTVYVNGVSTGMTCTLQSPDTLCMTNDLAGTQHPFVATNGAPICIYVANNPAQTLSTAYITVKLTGTAF